MNKQFLGSEVETPYEIAKAVILPIPYEATTSYRKGTQNGPEALLEASDQLEAYDEELQQEVCREVGIYTHPAIADTRHQRVTAQTMLQQATQTVAQLIQAGKFVVAVGGEHSITAGIVRAYRGRRSSAAEGRRAEGIGACELDGASSSFPDPSSSRLAKPGGGATSPGLKSQGTDDHQLQDEPFTVIQIDAHGDLRNQYEGSIYSHACVMRRILEMQLPTLPVGIRSICQEEAQLIQKKQIPVIWAREIATEADWLERALSKVTTAKVFLTIDVDGIDPSLVPGVGTPEPGGFDWYTLLKFLKQVFTRYQVIGCDVMELAPVADSVVSQFTIAKLVYKLIGYQALSQGWLKSTAPAWQELEDSRR